MRYVFLVLLAVVACAEGTPPTRACVTTRNCAEGMMCTNGLCFRNDRDAGVEDVNMQDVATDVVMDAVQDTALSDAALDVPPDAGACGAERCGWRLRGTTWSSFPLEGPFAPMLPVRAAFDFDFDLDDDDVAYLLTDTTYHVFKPADLSFTAAGSRDDLMFAARGVRVVSATSAPSGNPLFQIILAAADSAHLYSFDPATNTFAHLERVTEFGADWSGPRAPVRAVIQAAWRTSDNAQTWVQDSATCEVVGPYMAFIADGFVYPRDFGTCRVFLDIVPFDEFMPFAIRGAPSSAQIGAAFFHENELWVFDE